MTSTFRWTGLSSQLEDNALIRTMRAKVEGLEVLRKALKMSQKSAPAQWVLYGSVVAACGFPLSGAYAYANGASLDMAHSMRAEGEQVCWLGWSAWRGVGMSRNGLDAGQLASHGLHLLEPEQARLHHWRLAGAPSAGVRIGAGGERAARGRVRVPASR